MCSVYGGLGARPRNQTRSEIIKPHHVPSPLQCLDLLEIPTVFPPLISDHVESDRPGR